MRMDGRHTNIESSASGEDLWCPSENWSCSGRLQRERKAKGGRKISSLENQNPEILKPEISLSHFLIHFSRSHLHLLTAPLLTSLYRSSQQNLTKPGSQNLNILKLPNVCEQVHAHKYVHLPQQNKAPLKRTAEKRATTWPTLASNEASAPQPPQNNAQ